ncbi:pleckstrin homology (PH) domain-containing protein, partial [Striga asiatica]
SWWVESRRLPGGIAIGVRCFLERGLCPRQPCVVVGTKFEESVGGFGAWAVYPHRRHAGIRVVQQTAQKQNNLVPPPLEAGLNHARECKSEQRAPPPENRPATAASPPRLYSRLGEEQIHEKPDIHVDRVNNRSQSNPINPQIHVVDEKIRDRKMQRGNAGGNNGVGLVESLGSEESS